MLCDHYYGEKGLRIYFYLVLKCWTFLNFKGFLVFLYRGENRHGKQKPYHTFAIIRIDWARETFFQFRLTSGLISLNSPNSPKRIRSKANFFVCFVWVKHSLENGYLTDSGWFQILNFDWFIRMTLLPLRCNKSRLYMT